jgi:hypothetical protein
MLTALYEGIKRLAGSRKFLMAAGTMICTLLAKKGLNADPEIVYGLLALGVSVIFGIAAEDYAAKGNINGSQPTNSNSAAAGSTVRSDR